MPVSREKLSTEFSLFVDKIPGEMTFPSRKKRKAIHNCGKHCGNLAQLPVLHRSLPGFSGFAQKSYPQKRHFLWTKFRENPGETAEQDADRRNLSTKKELPVQKIRHRMRSGVWNPVLRQKKNPQKCHILWIIFGVRVWRCEDLELPSPAGEKKKNPRSFDLGLWGG